MGWVTMSARLLYIQQELNNIEWQIDQIARQKMSLHKYGSMLSDGKITMMEMAGMPIDHMGMAFQYIVNGQLPAMIDAKQWSDWCLGQVQQQGGMATPMLGYMMYKKALDERLEKAKKAEEERIKVIEEKLDYEMKKLEQRQKVLDKEYESVEKRIEKDIDRTTPKYA